MLVRDCLGYLDALTDKDFPEDGLHYGDPDRVVTGLLVCWMPNMRALRHAAERGCNLIVCHEVPFYASTAAPEGNDASPFYHWTANRRRKELLDAGAVSVIRCHRTVDVAPLPQTFERMLELPAPAVIESMAGHDAVRVYEVEPTPVRALAERWKAAIAVEQVRAYAPNPDRRVSRLAAAWGGIGLAVNMGVTARLVDLGAELLIGGEVDAYTVEMCADAGVDFVELGHSATETPGLRVVAEWLRAEFPAVPVDTFEEPRLWRIL